MPYGSVHTDARVCRSIIDKGACDKRVGVNKAMSEEAKNKIDRHTALADRTSSR